MKKLLLIISMILAVPAFADVEKSKLEEKVAELEKQNELRNAQEKAKAKLVEDALKTYVGYSLLGVAGFSATAAFGMLCIAGFGAIMENMTRTEFLRCFAPIGVPALAVAATSGYFGTKLTFGGTYGLLNNPLFNQKKQ